MGCGASSDAAERTRLYSAGNSATGFAYGDAELVRRPHCTATGRRAVRAGRGGVGGRETEDLCERTVLGALPAAFQVQADHGQEHLCAGQIFNRPCAWCLAPRGAWSCALISQRPLVLPVPHSLITHGPTRPASHPRICYRLPSLKSTACSRYQHEAKSLSSHTDGECTVYWGSKGAGARRTPHRVHMRGCKTGCSSLAPVTRGERPL